MLSVRRRIIVSYYVKTFQPKVQKKLKFKTPFFSKPYAVQNAKMCIKGLEICILQL